MRILVTGSNGMMGWGIKRVFDDLILTTKTNFDVTNPPREIPKCDIIFHLAAETDHHRAQDNPAQTYLINTIGTMNMVDIAKDMGIPIVYVSTVGIFDGKKKTGYNETDHPSPLNHYAKSKMYGESVVREYHRHYIVRGGWGMGGGIWIDKKFINKIFNKIKDGDKTIYAVTDVYGSPTYTVDFARTLKNIILQHYGTYTVASPDSCSRFELAQEFIRLLGIDVNLQGITKEQYHLLFPQKVQYQNYEIADCSKIKKISEMRPWRKALAEYTKECFSENLISVKSI